MSNSVSSAMAVDKSPGRKSSRAHSTDTMRTRRSHRSVSKDRSDRRRSHRDDESRRRSRSPGSERSNRDRDRSRERRRERDRDRERERERDRERRHRSDRDRDYRDRDRDRRDDRDRRRKRDDEDVDRDVKRKKEDSPPPPPGALPPLRRDSPPPRRRDFDRRDRRRGPPSPRRRTPPPQVDPFDEDAPNAQDSEARSVFVSQLAARLTARDLGYFFEDKLGENTVMDARIVTDRISRRSKGIGYVEFRTVELVDKALDLSGTVVMGLPIMVQLTEAERNRLHAGDGNLNLPPGVSAPQGGAMQLYVGSLHFNLTEADIKQVFEPFGELEFVDLHRDPTTGRSKGYAFVQYKRSEDARMAMEQMEGFELAGRQLKVNTVHDKGTVRYTQTESLDDSGGGNLNAASRQALMQKLARTDSAPLLPEPIARPNIPQTMESRSVLLKNMFDPEEETGNDWDTELADDVKGECEGKYGKVLAIKVEKETQGEIYVKFDSVDSARNAVQGLNGRWFGGKQVSAAFISDAIMQAHQ